MRVIKSYADREAVPNVHQCVMATPVCLFWLGTTSVWTCKTVWMICAFLIHSIIHIGHSSPTISWLQSQDHKPLFPACRTSLVEQASSYSLCFLSVWSIIITQLFSIVILWSWTTCWRFSWRFPLSSWNLPFLKVFPSVAIYPFLNDLPEFYQLLLWQSLVM